MHRGGYSCINHLARQKVASQDNMYGEAAVSVLCNPILSYKASQIDHAVLLHTSCGKRCSVKIGVRMLLSWDGHVSTHHSLTSSVAGKSAIGQNARSASMTSDCNGASRTTLCVQA